MQLPLSLVQVRFACIWLAGAYCLQVCISCALLAGMYSAAHVFSLYFMLPFAAVTLALLRYNWSAQFIRILRLAASNLLEHVVF